MARLHSLSILFVLLLAVHNVFSAASSWSCDFSNDMCGFTDSAGAGASWIRTDNVSIDPSHDHTCMLSPVKVRPIMIKPIMRKPMLPIMKQPNMDPVEENAHMVMLDDSGSDRKCFWLSTLPVAKFKGDQDFILYSPKQDKMDTDGCLKFSYHFFGLAKASFYVQVNGKQSTFEATNLFAKFVPQGNRWADAQVHVPKQDKEFYFIFKAHLDAKYHDVVGLDDIYFSPMPCVARGDTDFEDGNQVWTLDGATVGTNGKPVNDHTTNTIHGHFALSGTKQPSVLSASILNLTRNYNSEEYSNCLKFYYQFYAHVSDGDVGSYIDVNVTGATFSDKRITVESMINDGLEDTWQLASISIPSYKRAKEHDYTVKISMYTSKSTQILIDDIKVLDRYCQTPGDCDFESDFCGWTQASYTDGIWLRSDGANSGSLKESPKIDHTTLTEKGWFAVIPTEFMERATYTTFKSPPIYNTGSVNRCFQMAYFAHTKKTDQQVLRVDVKDLTKSGQTIVSKKVNGTTYGFWANFTIPFPKTMPKAYSIEITTVYTPSNLLSDIALDDFKLAYSCDGFAPNGEPSTTPIPYSERKWDCAFEYSCSGWTFNKNWVRTSYSKLGTDLGNANPPRLDHTYNTHTGGYLLYMPKVDDNINGTTQFVSILNSTNITGRDHCLSFYYYAATESLIQLDIVTWKSYGISISKSIRPKVASRSWVRVRADFQFISNTFNVSLVLHASKTANASFALDDISITPGECRHMEDYTYTMDTFENMDINRVQPIKGGIGRIVTPSYVHVDYPNAPTADHTTGSGGYFLFMNRKDDYNTTYKSELVIDNLEKSSLRRAIKGRCIQFAYQIVGNANLEVYVDAADADYHTYPIFHSRANHSKWTMVQTTFSAFYKHKITFIMDKKFDLKSYIALDDISFSDHCNRDAECDFDDDLCSYTSDYTNYNFAADTQFARFVGPPLTQAWPGPGYDHTKQSYGGGYLYLTGFPTTLKRKRTAQIQTPIMSPGYEKSSNSCFSFFTYLTAPDAEVTVGVRFFSREGDSNDIKLMKLTGLTETTWTRHYADIEGKYFKGKNEFLFTIDGSTSEINTVVAIDDIGYSSFECTYKHQFKCKNGAFAPMDRVCNFKDDCGDNSDELECGTCDFETDVCSWTNGTDFANSKLGGAYVPVQAGADHTGPDHDGTMNKTGHYLIVKKSQYSDKNYPFISDTTLTRYYDSYEYQFKDAYFTCYMTFSVYLVSQYPQSKSRIQVWAGSDKDSAVIKLNVQVDPNYNEWQVKSAFIGGFPHSFIVQFRATELAANETIALDNIKFNECGFPDPIKGDVCPDSRQILCNNTKICIDPDDLCDGENNCGDSFDESYSLCSRFKSPDVPVACSFEQSLDTCSMTLDNLTKTNNINWELTRGFVNRFTMFNMPSADHTVKDRHGQFMTLFSPIVGAKKKNFGQPVLLYSPMMTSDSQPCVARFFYYNMGNYNAKTNYFNVYVQYADGRDGVTESLFSSKNYIPTWNKAKAKMQSKEPFRFVFAGTINDPQGSISLDDITYTDTCYNSDAVYKPGKLRGHGPSAFVIILLIAVGLAAVGGAFFAWRKVQSGDLSLDSVRSIIPGSRKNPTAFDNPHFSK